jgi:hypothetical protein
VRGLRAEWKLSRAREEFVRSNMGGSVESAYLAVEEMWLQHHTRWEELAPIARSIQKCEAWSKIVYKKTGGVESQAAKSRRLTYKCELEGVDYDDIEGLDDLRALRTRDQVDMARLRMMWKDEESWEHEDDDDEEDYEDWDIRDEDEFMESADPVLNETVSGRKYAFFKEAKEAYYTVAGKTKRHSNYGLYQGPSENGILDHPVR